MTLKEPIMIGWFDGVFTVYSTQVICTHTHTHIMSHINGSEQQ